MHTMGAMPGLLTLLRQQQAGEIMAQGGKPIPEILDAQEMAFMQQVFPQIRVAASFDHPNWGLIGFPDGPPLSPVSYAAVRYVWPQIRVAADWSHPRWDLHPVPWNILAAAMPAPEAAPAPTVATPAPAPAPAPVPTGPTGPSFDFSPSVPSQPAPFLPSGPISYEPIPDDALEEGEPVAPIQAGMFGGGNTWMILAALTAAGFLLFGKPKPLSPFKAPRRRRRRR
jgi:hypothetical protein